MRSEPSERRRQTGLAPKRPNRRWGAPLIGAGVAALPVALLLTDLFAATRPNAVVLATDPLFSSLMWVGIAVVIALNAVFVAGEFAVDLLKPGHFADQDDPADRAVLESQLAKKESVVAACILGALTMRSWIVLLCLALAPSIGDSLGLLQDDISLANALGTIFLLTAGLSILAMTINVVVELVAKSYALARPADAALKLAPVLRVFDLLFRGPSILTARLAGIFSKRLGTDATFSTDVSKAEEEIKEILDSSEETGEIDDSERALLQSVFEFGDTVARTVMTPRVDVEAVPFNTDLKTIANLVEATGHSRFPVYTETDDQIVGIIHAKDVLRAMARGFEADNLNDLIRPAMFVPETKPLHDLLAEMRANRAQLVIVQDEFGGTAGILTIEDIVEELVGDIIDEYDVAVPEILTQGSVHLVSGKLHLDDLNNNIGSEFVSDEFDSIGGYVFGLFGRQPRIDESLEHEGFRFTIEESDGRRIVRLKIEAVDPELAEEPV